MRVVGISEREVKQIVFRVLTRLKHAHGTVSIHFVGDRRMARLNELFRGKHGPTDVLSFPDALGSGDIFLCVPHLHRQARRWGVNYREESIRMLIHGMLHLGGYDHERKKDADCMFTLQEKLLAQCV